MPTTDTGWGRGNGQSLDNIGKWAVSRCRLWRRSCLRCTEWERDRDGREVGMSGKAPMFLAQAQVVLIAFLSFESFFFFLSFLTWTEKERKKKKKRWKEKEKQWQKSTKKRESGVLRERVSGYWPALSRADGRWRRRRPRHWPSRHHARASTSTLKLLPRTLPPPFPNACSMSKLPALSMATPKQSTHTHTQRTVEKRGACYLSITVTSRRIEPIRSGCRLILLQSPRNSRVRISAMSQSPNRWQQLSFGAVRSATGEVRQQLNARNHSLFLGVCCCFLLYQKRGKVSRRQFFFSFLCPNSRLGKFPVSLSFCPSLVSFNFYFPSLFSRSGSFRNRTNSSCVWECGVGI